MLSRGVFCGLLLSFALLLVPIEPAAAEEKPLTGPAVAAYEPLDKTVLRFMDLLHATSATVALSRDGKLLYSRGYGWRDEAKKTPTPVDTLMRIASVSKPITAAEVKKLIHDKKLTLDTKVFPLLGIKPYNGKEGDRRFGDITVGHLLEHKGGWDRDKSYDPMFMMPQIEKELKLKKPAMPVNVIEYMLAQPLQFAPGERSAYSNFGYCVLGRVIEHVTGKSYADAMKDDIFKPHGIADLKLGHNARKDRDPQEVWYVEGDESFSVEVMDAHGGWIASAPALCKFMDAYWISGEPRKRGDSQNWTFFGSLPGTSSMARQRPDGLNVAVLFNNRTDADLGLLQKAVDAALDGDAGGAAEERYATIWDKGGPAWVACHGLNAADYQKAFDKHGKEGYRLTCVSGHGIGGEASYAAIWEKRKGPEWQARHGLSAADYQKAFDKFAGDGFRLVWVNGYTVSGEDRYAAIWEKREGPEWVARHGIPGEEYQKEFDKHAREGFRLTCVSGYSVGGKTYYAAVWEIGGPEWVACHGLNGTDYQKAFDKHAREGFRLTCVSGYNVGGEDRYAAIWEKRDGPEWVARHGIPAGDYQKEFDKNAGAGFRLTCVSGYTIGKGK